MPSSTTLLELDDTELQVSQQFLQLMRAIRNVRHSSLVYAGLRGKKTDWATDPNFVGHNADFDRWTNGLPPDLQISYPPDGAAPGLTSHVNANVHVYHYLSILMHHRPQLESTENISNGIWKQHMIICFAAATKICKLQEAVLTNFGLNGLRNMQRGINFTVYCVLTCTVVHLVRLSEFGSEHVGLTCVGCFDIAGSGDQLRGRQLFH